MKFDNLQIRDLYFDSLIDLFKAQKYNEFETGTQQLNELQIKKFLLYVYKNKESLEGFNSDMLMHFILDCL